MKSKLKPNQDNTVASSLISDKLQPLVMLIIGFPYCVFYEWLKGTTQVQIQKKALTH